MKLRQGDVVQHGTLRLSSPARTWCELGAVLDLADLVAAGDFLIYHAHPLASREALDRAVNEYAGRRGKPLLRLALPYLHDRSESRRESHLRVLLQRGNVMGLAINFEITTSGGFRYRADLAVPGRKVVIEYQSDYHADAQQFRRDMTRRARLEADGWMVILVNVDDLRQPQELLARIRKQLAMRPVAAN